MKSVYQNLICFIPSSQSNCQETDLLITSLRPMSCPDVLSTKLANSVLSQSKDKLSKWLSKSTKLLYNCCCSTADAAANVTFSICTLKSKSFHYIGGVCWQPEWGLPFMHFLLQLIEWPISNTTTSNYWKTDHTATMNAALNPQNSPFQGYTNDDCAPWEHHDHFSKSILY